MLYCNLYKLYWEVRSLFLNKQYSSFWELLWIQQVLNKNPEPRHYSCQVARLDEDLGWCGCEAHALSTHNHQRMPPPTIGVHVYIHGVGGEEREKAWCKLFLQSCCCTKYCLETVWNEYTETFNCKSTSTFKWVTVSRKSYLPPSRPRKKTMCAEEDKAYQSTKCTPTW